MSKAIEKKEEKKTQVGRPPAKPGLSRATRAKITSTILGKLIQKKDFISISKDSENQKLTPADIEPLYEGSEFSDEKLIDICRLIALGLSEQNAAKAIGIHRNTLRRWKEAIPGVADELSKARYLAIGAVASILRALMISENEAVALRAVEFFLKTRSKEFREKQDVEVELDIAAIQRRVRRDLYGRLDDDEETTIEEEIIDARARTVVSLPIEHARSDDDEKSRNGDDGDTDNEDGDNDASNGDNGRFEI